MEKLHYNLIFGIGQSCGCSDSLRYAKLQHLSFPGDWTAPLYGQPRHPFLNDDLCERTDILCDGSEDFFNAEHFIARGIVSNTGKAIYFNVKTRYVFNHDFAVGAEFKTEFPKVVAKYEKRKERLFELIAGARRILVVRMDIPGGKYPTSLEACRYARRRLNERFPHAKVDVLLISLDPAIPFEKRAFEQVEDGLFHLSFDYLDHKRTDLANQPDLRLTGAALAELFTVDDYRSREEKRAFARRRRQKKIARLKQRLSKFLSFLPRPKKRYDLAFGLGSDCSCSEILRQAHLQWLSLPYDWLTTDAKESDDIDKDVVSRARDICDGFSTWLDKGDFQFVRKLPEFSKDQYLDARHKLLFDRDFTSGSPLDSQFDGVCAKYRRRCARLTSLLRDSRRVLVAHVDRPDVPASLGLEAVRKAKALLGEAFPKAQFDFCLLSYEKGRPFEKRKTEDLGDGIVRTVFDYRDYTPGKQPHQVDLVVTGGFMSGQFKVRDYRTAAEKRSFRRQKWEKRCQKAGVSNRCQYHERQIAAFFHGRYNLLADAVARFKRQRFEQIVILGFNCEAAFRFVCKWDFLDSSLLAWTNSRNLDILVKAIRGINAIGSGEMFFHEASRMWLCKNSNIYFHGKMRAVAGAPKPTPEELAADLSDLRGRLTHLKEKFLTYARNEKSTLYVYKLGAEDAAAPTLGEKLDALEAALNELGASNAHLLVVCERSELGRMPAGAGRTFRSVLKFNPGNDVTSRRKGDPAGWNRIFSEFAPAHILKRTHKFKYE